MSYREPQRNPHAAADGEQFVKNVARIQEERRETATHPDCLFTCPKCHQQKPGGEMSSTADLCLACESEPTADELRKLKEREYWAEQRAAGRAAFIVHNSARGAFKKGTAVAYCCNCEQIVTGSKAIKRHFDHCRRK